ncbi:MAG: LamG-like jellyroll fold domain-containing protein [Akkermansiaceae bacterium]
MHKRTISRDLVLLIGFTLTFPLSAATLAHRWSFDTDPADSVGGNTGILNDGATINDGQLQLTGLGSSTTANRMSFTNPVDIGGNFGASGVTIESWYTDTGTGTWGKLFQFGNNVAGQELAYTHTRGNGQQSGIDRDGAQLLGEQVTQNEEHHLVITVSPDGNLNAWVDGEQKLTDIDTNDLSNVNTTFEAIGATSWGDPGMTGSVNEFRIWSGELISSDVVANGAAGPDEVPGNLDTDNDGLPDSWEEKWFGPGNLSQEPDDNPDNDGLSNLEEFNYHPNLNPDDDDTDSDGITDGMEVNTTLTDPLDNDSDGDSLTDGDEVNNHGTDPLDVDSDSDFISDGAEIENGTDPNDINDPGLFNPTLVHRWSFTAGAELVDSVGGNTGILNATATVSGDQLQLDGAGTGDAASSMRFSSPIDIGTNFLTNGVTIESWYTDAGTPTWGKLFTFGGAVAGNELAWTNIRGNADAAPGLDRDGAKEIASIPFGSNDRLALDEEHHLVISVAPDGTTNVWIDGVREITNAATNNPSNITTDTESIGSTAWNDPGHLGSVNEFRVWEGLLTESEVSQNFALGPDAIGGQADLAISAISRNNNTGAVTLIFNAISGRRYRILRSEDLATAPLLWTSVEDEFIAPASPASFTDNTASGNRLFYRVEDITNR